MSRNRHPSYLRWMFVLPVAPLGPDQLPAVISQHPYRIGCFFAIAVSCAARTVYSSYNIHSNRVHVLSLRKTGVFHGPQPSATGCAGLDERDVGVAAGGVGRWAAAAGERRGVRVGQPVCVPGAADAGAAAGRGRFAGRARQRVLGRRWAREGDIGPPMSPNVVQCHPEKKFLPTDGAALLVVVDGHFLTVCVQIRSCQVD